MLEFRNGVDQLASHRNGKEFHTPQTLYTWAVLCDTRMRTESGKPHKKSSAWHVVAECRVPVLEDARSPNIFSTGKASIRPLSGLSAWLLVGRFGGWLPCVPENEVRRSGSQEMVIDPCTGHPDCPTGQ